MKPILKGMLVSLALLATSAGAQEAKEEAQNRARTELGAGSDSRAMIRSLEVEAPAGVTEVSIALPVEFAFAKAQLTPQGRAIVVQLAQAMNAPELLPRVFLVEGHTDAVGGDQANLVLSRQRAETVRTELVTLGVAPVRLEIAGYGELRLIPGIPSDHGRNRRVEIVSRVP